ncbi:MAG: hypothetical protein M9962_04770 [Oligoflexia bacterium]|nr:hypothetical protein [Oligoflexia bacterium]
MKTHKILGIYRLPKFSNNAIEADRLILENSLQKLANYKKIPIQVDYIEEPEIASASSNYDLVFTMCQSEEALEALEKTFAKEKTINSAEAIRNCYRKKMSQLLSQKNVGYEPFSTLNTKEEFPYSFDQGTTYWLKRSDFHAISDEDVTLVENAEEAKAKLKKFQERGIQEVIIQKHIHGDIYKFYGVNSRFFKAIKVRNFLDSTIEPDYALLEKIAHTSAAALNLKVYGGDCVVDRDGGLHIIDVNDWPSFRICREEASTAIAELGIQYLLKAQYPIEEMMSSLSITSA